MTRAVRTIMKRLRGKNTPRRQRIMTTEEKENQCKWTQKGTRRPKGLTNVEYFGEEKAAEISEKITKTKKKRKEERKGQTMQMQLERNKDEILRRISEQSEKIKSERAKAREARIDFEQKLAESNARALMLVGKDNKEKKREVPEVEEIEKSRKIPQKQRGRKRGYKVTEETKAKMTKAQRERQQRKRETKGRKN